jgi:hypothetical protein
MGLKALTGTAVEDMSSLGWEIVDHPQQSAVATRAIRLRGRRGAPAPPWVVPAIARIGELDLTVVDPQSDRPLNFDDVIDALDFLTRVMRDDTCAPWVGRLSSGGVELTWQHGDVEVEAVFDRLRGEAEVVVAVGEREWDAPADEADSLFATVVERLSSSYVEHATA